jgi:hypothetical protein
VGKNPYSFPEVRRIDGTSWNPKNRDLITKGLQVSVHLLDAQMEEPIHIFTKKPSGPENGETPHHFRPEIAVVVGSSSLPGSTEGLTGESATDKIDAGNPSPIDGGNIVVARDCWPMLLEDFPTIVVVFNLPFNLHSGSFKSKVKPSYP